MIARVLLGALVAATIPTVTVVSPATAVPNVGDCYDYKANDTKAEAAGAPAVDCGTKHTAQTYWVGTLPDSFGNPAKASGAARLAATKPCTTAAVHQAVGLNDRAMPSRFQTIEVFPSKPQWQAGERWVRCDVILRGGPGFTRFAGSAAELVAASSADHFDFCTAGVPGSRTRTAYPCTKPNKNWIMVSDVRLGKDNARFPGPRSIERKGRAACKAAGKPYSQGKKFYAWWGIWPTAAGWRQGERTVQCFVPLSAYQQTMTPPPAPAAEPTG